MKRRRKVGASGFAASMVLALLLTFPSAAHAAVGNFTMTGTLGGASVAAVGTGTVGLSSWTGSFMGTGSLGCMAHSLAIPAAGDVITWDGLDTATQVMTDIEIVYDASGCPPPLSGECRITLDGARITKTAVGGFPQSGIYRSGTFDHVAGAILGGITFSQVAPTNDCLSSGLAAQLATYYGCSVPSVLPFSCFSVSAFTASLAKTIEVV